MLALSSLRWAPLPPSLFPNGFVYFRRPPLPGVDPPPQPALIHCNWIGGITAKRYLLREAGLWRAAGAGGSAEGGRAAGSGRLVPTAAGAGSYVEGGRAADAGGDVTGGPASAELRGDASKDGAGSDDAAPVSASESASPETTTRRFSAPGIAAERFSTTEIATERSFALDAAGERFLIYITGSGEDALSAGGQLRALRSAVALADVTNRTLVLPAFHCCIRTQVRRPPTGINVRYGGPTVAPAHLGVRCGVRFPPPVSCPIEHSCCRLFTAAFGRR
jgi:hypothetical protein